MLEKYLQELGLSEKEAQIYLALLQVDNESIQDLAKRTGINRTTVYPVLETLEKKGLVSEVQVGKKTNYEAAAPERLETFVERQRVVLEERSERLKDIIPQIKGLQREKGERPVIKFFEGRDGAISAYEEFYSFADDVEKDGFFIMNTDLLKSVFNEKELTRFREIRKNKKISGTVIYNNHDGNRKFDSVFNSKHISQEFLISTDIGIVDDKVIISTLGDRVTSMLIQSKDFSDTLASLVKYILNK